MKLPEYQYESDSDGDILIRYNGNLDFFTTSLLNIGELKTPAKPIEVIAVVFDLEGFTLFSKQVDAYLTLPSFVDDFFNWLFEIIKKESIMSDEQNTLYSELPFFSKFMGDGALFLWKINIDEIAKLGGLKAHESLQTFLCNIVVTMDVICKKYKKFYDTVQARYTDAPTKLRCGIARGIVVPIGGGRDFVGPCINIASRLQKFNGLSFACSARGIDKRFVHEESQKNYQTMRVNIRGIGDSELIYVLSKEYDSLAKDKKANFLNVEKGSD